MFDFLRTTSAVPSVRVGNVKQNTKNILEKLNEAIENGSDIVVFPELAVTGYTCEDLFFQEKLISESLIAIETIIGKTANTVAVVGTPLNINNQLYNTAVVIYGGKIIGIVPKTFVANYNEFYEKRWFSSANDLDLECINSKSLGFSFNYEIPIGNDLIFNLNNQTKFAVEICEDLWAALPPSTFLALGGAEVILNLSASNETVNKRKYRRDLVTQQSARQLCGYVFTSAGACESTTDLVFSGHSVIAENGTVIAENKEFIDDNYILSADIDLGKIRADRKRLQSFKESAVTYGIGCREIFVDYKGSLQGDGSKANINKSPFVPLEETDRLERCLSVFQMQVAGLKKRMNVTGGKAVVGVSGGLDSTLALLVAAEATRQLGRPISDVVGITMPCFGTSDRTYNNSKDLMDTLGVTSVEINIKEACEKHFKDIGHDINIKDTTFENVQARERTQVLMDYAGRVGGFVVGTGDLSELALGWCTYNADHMSMYGVNAGVPKSLIRWMIDSISHYNIFPNSTAVLKDIIDTPISPELLPPDKSGKIAQKTEDLVGPYALHDFFLYNMVRFGFSPEKIYYLAKISFKNDFDNATILKWLKTFYRRFFTQQFKRNCMPDGVKIGSISLSPRGDWKMPSDAESELWLVAVDNLKA